MRAALLFAAAWLVRVPFQASYLVNWDSVNFALGVEDFSLERHQPHPPGYLGYVLLGRLVGWLVGDPVAALTAISVIAGAAATAGVYLLGRRLATERAALIAAALFGTSPLVWYYSEVPLTYAVEVALALPLVILVLDARERRSRGLLLLAAALLAFMGAVRQTSMVLLFPVWLYAWFAFPRRTRVLSAAVLAGGMAAWLIPLLALSGGPSAYFELSSQLAQLTGGGTWIGAGWGVAKNFLVVGVAAVLGLPVALLAIPLATAGRSPEEPLRPQHRRLLLLWGLPALLVYLFIHIGQLGYLLLVLPVGSLWAARVVDGALARSSMRVAVAGALVVVNVVGYFVLPEMAYAGVRSGSVDVPERVGGAASVERGLQQVSLSRSDAFWESLIEWIEGYDPATVAVLAEPRFTGTFRHLSFYLPDYTVYGIGTDTGGLLGHLFTSAGRETDYSVEKLDGASPHLLLPAEVRTLLIPDPRLQERVEGALDLEYHELGDGSTVALAEVPAGSSLLFLASSGEALLMRWSSRRAAFEGFSPGAPEDPDPADPAATTDASGGG